MLESIEALRAEAVEAIRQAADLKSLEEIRHSLLGRKRGSIKKLQEGIRDVPPEERPAWGKALNEIVDFVKSALEARESELKRAEAQTEPKPDFSLPGRHSRTGALHPLTQVMNELNQLFVSWGYELAEGPEIELDSYNYQALNFPDDHPARDMHDTIYISNDVLLRTHTSPVQIRAMENRRPPFAFIAPGKTYRHDSDATHSPMFHQLEGFVVGENISFAHLKGALHELVNAIFHKDVKMRFRPSFFPFTEPSAEIDIACFSCRGKGCRLCKDTGWLEILGAGMIHPFVLRQVDIDPMVYSGFAFGLGIERTAMLRYGIDDIRIFFDNDVRFLQQFA